MKYLLSILLCLNVLSVLGQEGWIWEERTPMPKAMSNNAVAEGTVDNVTYVYSFGGIDTTKIWSGISNDSFRYNTETDTWESIPPLPLETPVIAAGASTVNNKIYIIGGYEVASNGSEVSSKKLFIYDPETNAYTEGAELPIATDDHIQAVWRDSLIYVATGWSNNTNINAVQIYDTANDSWEIGTAVPNTNDFKVFGGSGAIVGDTLYYAGGAKITTFSFVLTNHFRKGIINPENPTEIEWLGNTDSLALGYRMAATEWNNQVLWLGGSVVAYNYNGIAYNGTGGVPPLNRILQYDPLGDSLFVESDTIPSIMDLRGIARLDENTFMLVGGMGFDQQVQDKAYWIHYQTATDTMNTTIPMVENNANIKVYPTITKGMIYVEAGGIDTALKATIWDVSGKSILTKKIKNNESIDINDVRVGTYILTIERDGEILYRGQILKE